MHYDPRAWLHPVYARAADTTIIVGLADPEREAVVFVGFARGIDGTGADRAREIDYAIARIFNRYPAAPGLRDAGDADAMIDGEAEDDGGT